MKSPATLRTASLSGVAGFACITILFGASSSAIEIQQQKFPMETPPRGEVRSEPLLKSEIPEVEATHVAIAGPASHTESPVDGFADILLFIQGRGSLGFNGEDHEINSETIALPISSADVAIHVAEGDVLHYVRIRKQFSKQDLLDMKDFASRAGGGIYLKKFEDCEAYREAIKSPKTTSRTVLPAEFIPRVAMGTVQTTGPDEVGAHRHPMLDQLFLGLVENDVIVTADDTHARFTEFSLLHIPLGSLHGVKAQEGTKMYYMWMDFFLTKEGEEWLKTHKPVTE
ncbi:MAG: hypothetical protein SH868_08255 [Bythopirellula sp.]|nr:hypothetical protein [Bythopirellula sp.]